MPSGNFSQMTDYVCVSTIYSKKAPLLFYSDSKYKTFYFTKSKFLLNILHFLQPESIRNNIYFCALINAINILLKKTIQHENF